jgi:hypothetical protein
VSYDLEEMHHPNLADLIATFLNTHAERIGRR